MQVAILCGGLGTRFREETVLRPKPMVEIGHKPMLWHIMRYYRHFGHREFVLCTGYKGNMIKDYFLNYRNNTSDIEIDLEARSVTVMESPNEQLDWKVTIQDTGIDTQTGSRLKRAMHYVTDELFLATYGDGLCDVDLDLLVKHHQASGKLATVTAVRPSSRFGELGLHEDSVTSFEEKPQTGQGWINGGFFVFHRSIFERLPNDDTITLEAGVLQPLARDGELSVFRHGGFWQCMDTVREMSLLEDYYATGRAPWKVWP
jgi:glucose-1-phosphate cytidylyltransferase